MENLNEKLTQICYNYGANNARIINVDQIIFNRQMREWCKDNVCGNYGKNYACPPSAGTIDELIKVLNVYKKEMDENTKVYLSDFEYNGLQKNIEISKVEGRKELFLFYEMHEGEWE